MKKQFIQSVALFLSSVSLSAFATPCDKPEDMQKFAHCVVYGDLSMPNDMCKYVREDDYIGDHFFSSNVACISPGTYFDIIEKQDIGQDAMKPGNYSSIYSQCDNVECLSPILLGTDNFIINADGTATPYKFIVPLNAEYGETPSYWNLVDGYQLNFDLSINGVCQYNDVTSYKYCGKVQAKKNVNKYLKFVDNVSSTMMCANNNTRFGYWTEDRQQFMPGKQSLKVYQCDNVQCLHPISIGKDVVSLDEQGKVDHDKFAVTINPSYGDNCTPLN